MTSVRKIKARAWARPKPSVIRIASANYIARRKGWSITAAGTGEFSNIALPIERPPWGTVENDALDVSPQARNNTQINYQINCEFQAFIRQDGRLDNRTYEECITDLMYAFIQHGRDAPQQGEAP